MSEKSLMEKISDIDDRLGKIEDPNKGKPKKEKEFKIKIPPFVKKAAKKDTNKVAAIIIGANRTMKVTVGEQIGGNWYIDKNTDNPYMYEEAAVFYYKKTPCIIVLEWRLMPVGGMAEEYRTRVLGGEDDQVVAAELGIKRAGQQVIIRAIEKAELDNDKKKGAGMGWIFWILGAGVAIYLLMKMFGGG